jgi:hypothetical protein
VAFLPQDKVGVAGATIVGTCSMLLGLYISTAGARIYTVGCSSGAQGIYRSGVTRCAGTLRDETRRL